MDAAVQRFLRYSHQKQQRCCYESLHQGSVDCVAIGKARAACAQSFALWQQATIEITRRDHSIIA